MLQALARWKTTILAVSALLFVGLLLSRHLVGPRSGGGAAVGPVSAEEVGEQVGKRAEVCGRVAEVVQASGIDGQPTFINLGDTHPDQSFTALIWASDRAKWQRPPAALYDEQSVCVTGSVERHEGTPQIIVSSPRQVRVR